MLLEQQLVTDNYLAVIITLQAVVVQVEIVDLQVLED
jgi:hypothetical protein